MNNLIRTKGHVEVLIEYKDGHAEQLNFSNAILDNGREALARVLANDLDDTFDLYVSRMLFGNGGAVSNVPQFVNGGRTGLFGTTVANKAVIANIDPEVPSQVVFTCVLKFDDANGEDVNEVALQLNNGDLYSMATFAGLSKTSDMQVTMGWKISFV